MAKQSLEFAKQAILEKLMEAGTAGLTRGRLGIKDAGGPAARALKALEEEREVANLGTRTKTCYVLREFYKPLELACEQVEANAKKAGLPRSDLLALLSRKDLERGCKGEIRRKVDEAVDWLVKERKLLRFRRGRLSYCVHAQHVKALVSDEDAFQGETRETPAHGQVPGRSEVLNAYKRAKERLGYSNVEIYELRKELGAPMEQVKAFLLEANRQGSAVLSLGDWSLSSDETRSGAIELFGKPHLLVRFRDEA